MGQIRFVDLCAGLGGFHRGASLARAVADGAPQFNCVLSSEADEGLRGVYAQNFGEELERTYRVLFPPARCVGHEALGDLWDEDERLVRVHGRIEALLESWEGADGNGDEMIVPPHDLLMAGFPCQPFSKSGAQLGFDDEESGRGTVFHLIARILEVRKPSYVLLENVGNFERHDGGNTWATVREWLERSYDVIATSHVGLNKGEGLLSPHLFGLPHHRERFFICAQRKELGGFERHPFPLTARSITDKAQREERQREVAVEASAALAAITQGSRLHASAEELEQAQLTAEQVGCISHWQALLSRIDRLGDSVESNPLRPLPSFPIWGFELDPWHHYPFEEDCPPALAYSDGQLKGYRRAAVTQAKRLGLAEPASGKNRETFHGKPVTEWLDAWPGYASRRNDWPRWKQRFIEQNRDLAWRLLEAFAGADQLDWYRSWLDELYEMSPSFQKLEWNCQGEVLDLWQHILQFRPSGLRVKRFRHVPALVALTTTQVPIVPRPHGEPHHGGDPRSRSRFLLPTEGKRLQGLDWGWTLPERHTRAFKALGNAVHAEVVSLILQKWLLGLDVGEPERVDETVLFPM
ncbi:DNA (cytosine-5-)-methyltransferase [Planctomycetota bacterium]|nr:DNA (cytosine-5-)-methyltransferase [Planctomycetota bacterium]